MISYAQNFEDVILMRALKGVAQGFYIDIGAQDPDVDSVSRAFYELGWRGVHVEPTPAYARRIREARADERVLEAAISAERGPTTLYEIPDTGLSTGRKDFADRHEESGFAGRRIEVETTSLEALFSSIGSREIHWLKIDVEGMERSVLQSWGDAAARPWIVLVESTLPCSQVENHAEWEALLTQRGYDFAYFDGLNRFYVHETHPELREAFGPGPNLFDEFALALTPPANAYATGLLRQAQNEITQLQHQIAHQNARIARMTDEMAALAARISALSATLDERERHITGIAQEARHWAATARNRSDEIAAMRRSTSWRLSAPVRWIGGWLRRMLSQRSVLRPPGTRSGPGIPPLA
jgi:FkbM family methyltransferase